MLKQVQHDSVKQVQHDFVGSFNCIVVDAETSSA